MISIEPNWTVMLSTDALPERDRFAIWREEFGRTIFKNEIAQLPGQAFRETVALSKFPGLGIVAGSTEGRIHSRKGALLADGNDDFILTTVKSGTGRVSHLGRELFLGSGDSFLASASDAGIIHWGKAQYTAIAVPRRAVSAFVSKPEALVTRSLAGARRMLALLASYIELVSDHDACVTAEMRHLFVAHVHDLVALALGATGDPAVAAKGRGLKAARLRAIKQDITENIVHRDLSVTTMAARHNMTPRYVQMLFEAEGSTFTEFVNDRRLARAYRILNDPRLSDRTISAIALECGFRDLSHFNRLFQRAFGATPSGVRAMAWRKD
ncbi:AraC family transcriptional regulator [Bradyrhizobium liaoningense]|uniref:AraC family transcriptional regulator n=1 Tax=Bradyrhizobium liaoningense TaxID=43992 RepID=UPI001BA688E4|nr:AraC family transcriptional regulator [Bradyrhizobium liaoningense]MBR0712570.1 helix-turn-helix transcriptional regulator [Bradyrhizobium liaoningense]